MGNGFLLTAADKLLDAIIEYYGSGEYVKPFRSKDVADCVVQHAAAAGVTAMGAGILPGAGSLVAMGISVGAIWTMYVRICMIIGVELGKNKLKALASAVVTNIVTQMAGIFAMEFAFSLIPGAGIVIVGAGNFVIVYIAGLIFLTTLTQLFKVKRSDVENMSNDEWIASLKESISNIDKKAVFKEAKDFFMGMKRDGSLNNVGESVDINVDNSSNNFEKSDDVDTDNPL